MLSLKALLLDRLNERDEALKTWKQRWPWVSRMAWRSIADSGP